jgi:hypothetical protein
LEPWGNARWYLVPTWEDISSNIGTDRGGFLRWWCVVVAHHH